MVINKRNAAKRFLAHFRREHPHLPLIINDDALSSNAPHIRDLEANNIHYILGVKPGDHKYFFQDVNMASEAGETTEFVITDKNKLNKSNHDVRVNFLEY